LPSTPFDALFLVFSFGAVVLLLLFVLTAALAARNRSRRKELEAKERTRRVERVEGPSTTVRMHVTLDDGTEFDVEPRHTVEAVIEPEGLLVQQAETLTTGDLVMSRELRETYIARARNLGSSGREEVDDAARSGNRSGTSTSHGDQPKSDDA
jgi:hypothetical protein